MKRNFILLCLILLVLGCLLPLGGYTLTRAVMARTGLSDRLETPAKAGSDTGGTAALPPSEADAEVFLIEDESTGEVLQLSRRDYIIGAVAAEMPVSWPDEALKAQAVASHSYALYCRDHAAAENGAWLSADPARRQGCLTDTVLHSYWGADYEANLARLSGIVDEVLTQVLYYGGEPACTCYFAISNGKTEDAANVWGSALPYLVSVDSPADLAADNCEYTVSLSAEQMRQALSSGLGITAAGSPEQWFGAAQLTAAGYVSVISVCGQNTAGTAVRRALGLRSACFEIVYSGGSFSITTRGYGHGVGLSQWGAKAMAEQGQTCAEILAHYFPNTELRG